MAYKSAEVPVLMKALGLNTKDHPSSLASDAGTYLSQAQNVDITDSFDVKRRDGYSVIQGGYSSSHSLFGFLNRYAIYADGVNLYCYDSVVGSIVTIKADLTPNKPICYTMVGDNLLAFTTGFERGVIQFGDSGAVECVPYFPFIADPSQSEREIVEFPLVDIMHYFNGSMYGCVSGKEFVYSSEPYKPNHYDQVAGYIPIGTAGKWINDVSSSLIVGGDSGIFALSGHGLGDFNFSKIYDSPSILCSNKETFLFTDGGGAAMAKEGILALCEVGVIFISGNLEILVMTKNIDFNFGAVSIGSLGKVGNNRYIFSGEMT